MGSLKLYHTTINSLGTILESGGAPPNAGRKDGDEDDGLKANEEVSEGKKHGGGGSEFNKQLFSYSYRT